MTHADEVSRNTSADPTTRHIPVMMAEVMAGLAVVPGSDVLDGTVGGGGHAAVILQASAPDGRLLGLDRDPGAVRRAGSRLAEFGTRAHLTRTPFDELDRAADDAGFTDFDGVLFDLGLSTDQLDEPSRGFSFSTGGPLDMRMDPDGATAATFVNDLPEGELADIIFNLGDEPRSRRIARAIVRARPVETTEALAHVVARSAGYRGGRTHPATRTFQALRMAVNDELPMLERALPRAIGRLRPEGRIVVISFHSIEDRAVKQAFRHFSATCVCPPGIPECRCDHTPSIRVVTRRPLVPTPAEIASNPRARSARLRVGERLAMPEVA